MQDHEVMKRTSVTGTGEMTPRVTNASDTHLHPQHSVIPALLQCDRGRGKRTASSNQAMWTSQPVSTAAETRDTLPNKGVGKAYEDSGKSSYGLALTGTPSSINK